MNYDETLMRIGRVANGYEIECYMPEKKEEKQGKDVGCCVPSSRWVTYVFSDKPGKPAIDEVMKFVGDKLPKIERSMAKEYDDAFEEATNKK